MAVIVWKELGTLAGYSTCVLYSDNDLVVALRAGEEKVFEDVFRSFYPALCRYAESIVAPFVLGSVPAPVIIV